MPDEKITEDVGQVPVKDKLTNHEILPESKLPFENDVTPEPFENTVIDEPTDPLVFIHDVYRYLFLKPMELLDDKPKGRIEQARHEGKLEILRDLRQIHKKHFGGE